MTTANRKTRRMRLPQDKVNSVAMNLVLSAMQYRGETIKRNIANLQNYSPKDYKQLWAILHSTRINGCTLDDAYIPETAEAIALRAVAILRGRA